MLKGKVLKENNLMFWLFNQIKTFIQLRHKTKRR